MTKKEMQDLIQRVCDKFKRETGMDVTGLAIGELLEPAVPHLDDVTQKLYENKISTSFLEQSVLTVLNNALTFARSRNQNYVGYEAIKDSMAKECPYAFWC
jgi:hypothetical protein